MLNINQLPPSVRHALTESLSDRFRTPAELDAHIAAMTPVECLDVFFTWHGFIKYTDFIFDAVNSVQASEIK